MSATSSQTPQSSAAALQQRSAQLEQTLNRLLAQLKLVPLKGWQWLISLLLLIWLCHSLAHLVWLLVPSPQIPPPAVTALPPSSASGGASAPGVAVNLEQLKNLTPFGSAPVIEATAAPEVTNTIENEATDTQLNLVLRGVLASNDDSAARAVISSGDKGDVYAIGDKLPVGNNVTLAKVMDVRVILNNGGHYESLWLFKDDPNAPKIASSYAAPPQTDMRTAGYGKPPFQQAPPHPVREEGPTPGAGQDPRMAEMGKTLADVVAMSIYRENGQVVGYKIRPGRNAEMFNSLGLQTDDIVTAVNGVPLTSPGKIMEIYKNMSNATSANLEIRRGGSVINLDVVLN